MIIVNVISLLQHCYHVFPELAYLPPIPPTHYVITCCLSKSGANYMQIESENRMKSAMQILHALSWI